MSWSIYFMGKPALIAEALLAHSEKISGSSKEEYDAALPHLDAALPHLVSLVTQNNNKGGDKIIKLSASGSAWSRDGELQDSSCIVQLESIGSGLLV